MPEPSPAFRYTAAFGWAWRMFRRSPVQLLALGGIGFGLRIGFGVIGFIVEFAVTTLRDTGGLTWSDFRNPHEIAPADILDTVSASGVNLAIGVGVGVVVFLCLQLTLSIVNLGLIRLSLGLASGQPMRLRDACSLRRWPRFVGASILVWCSIGVGALLCLIGAVVPATMFAFFGFFIADRDATARTALRESWRLVAPRLGPTFLLLATALAVVVAGRYLVSIADVFTAPFATLLLAYGYLHLGPERAGSDR